MSIQKQMVEQLYSLADKAQGPDQIKALQQQITNSIQNGAVPAYAAIPLVQDLTGRLQKAIAMQQMPGQPQAQGIDQPPIAEQVLAQAQGLDSMPSNLPTEEQAYAAGGIVAFAEGDLIDDDEIETEDDRQEASLMSLMAAARNKIQSGLGRATSGFTSALPKSIQGMLPNQKTEAPTTAPAEGGLSGLLSSAATKYGVPATLLNRVAGSESSGKADAANPRSSAKGVFQFTDSTWKGMGGKPGEQFNPEANVDLGAKYIRQNAEHLKKTLGRDPNYHEVYAAHMFGPGVSRMLNKANPKDPIERGLAMFESPQMVKKILKANPNLRGKTVGEVMNTLQLKTGQGIVALARGGEIKHFAAGGSDDVYSPEGVLVSGESTRAEPEKPEWEKEWERKYGKPKGTGPLGLTPGESVIPVVDQPLIVTPPTASQTDSQAGTKGAPETPVTETVDPYLEKYMGMLQKRETESEKQKEIDGYMALMQAGLGMMSGSSPYALQNIGAGGAQGLTAYAAAQKQRAAEDAATLSGYGKLYTAKEAAGLRRDLAEQGKETKLLQLGQDKKIQLGRQIDFLEKSFDTIAERNIKTALGNGFTELDENQKLQSIAKEAQRLRAKSTRLKDLYNQLGVPEPDVAAPENKALSPDEYYKMFGLKPKPKPKQ